jgi:hypothetical protein
MKRGSSLFRTLSLLATLASAGCGEAVPAPADGNGGSSLVTGGTGSTGGAGSSGAAGSASGAAGTASDSGGQGTSGTSGGGTGTTGGAGSAGSPSMESPYANFATMTEIVMVKCGGAGCHSGEMPPTLVADGTLHGTLTSYVSKLCGNRVLVKPGAPEDSAFYLAQAGLCGDTLPKMPLGCVDACVPADYVDGVRAWIAAGAPH